MADRPPLSVVVATRDRPDHLARCLDALRASLGHDDELIVVDSASRDDATRRVAAAAGARVVVATQPGTSRARNLGTVVATHEVVAFVDDDVRVAPGWADALAAAFREPTTAFAAGRVAVPPEQGAIERPVATTARDAPDVVGRSTPGPWGAGCNAAFRRSVLTDVGGFDERLGPGTWFASAEDLDVFDRILAVGGTGRHVATAVAFHAQWRARRQLIALEWRYGKGMGARLVRLQRMDPARARAVAREVLWEGGIRAIVADIRGGYEFGAAAVATRTLGTAVGALTWMGLTVRPRR